MIDKRIFSLHKKFLLAAALLSLTFLLSCNRSQQTSSVAEIFPTDSVKDIVSKAAHVAPTARQLAWQKLEFQAFVHFGMNTFTDREWGEGKEDPELFNPSAFDADQWLKSFKAAGMKCVILTAKHHDGFCLWPTEYTEHSVKNSPWKDGQGDVVMEVAEACRRSGLKFGVYLSPWDKHEQSYGDSPKYNEFFRNQLTELLTNYGQISEVWFDGACGEGPNGKRQVYDWPSYYALIRKLQPGAVISIKGPDVRWCGNEAGKTRESEWSVIPLNVHPEKYEWPDLTQDDLGSQEKIKDASYLIWYPAQTNTSIRPGWFYHSSQDNQVKSLKHLLEIYFRSVGGNTQFLLNIPPDRRGLIHDNDVARLKELGDVLRRTFSKNLAQGAKASASSVKANNHDAGRAADGNPETYWTADDWNEKPIIEFNLGEEKTFNCAVLQEYIKAGQRVEEFSLESWDGYAWNEIARSTTIGYKRILLFSDVKAQRVRVCFIKTRLNPTLSEFGLYQANF